MKTKEQFTPFYFEGNMYFGLIDSKETFNELMKAYRGHADISTARAYDGSMPMDKPSFGFYSEYRGKQTLGQWMKQNNII